MCTVNDYINNAMKNFNVLYRKLNDKIFLDFLSSTKRHTMQQLDKFHNADLNDGKYLFDIFGMTTT